MSENVGRGLRARLAGMNVTSVHRQGAFICDDVVRVFVSWEEFEHVTVLYYT